MRPLLPTLKEKKRYLVYKLESEQPVKQEFVLQQLKKVLGLFDSASAGILSVSYDSKKQVGVLRVSTAMVDKVKIALGLLPSVRGVCLGVSGMINKTARFSEV